MSTPAVGLFHEPGPAGAEIAYCALRERVLKPSNEPHFLSIAAASAPAGLPPPPGFMLLQKNVWFQTCAELLKMPPEDFLTMSSSFASANSVPLIRLLRFVKVGLVVLAVVELEGFLRDVRCERVHRVRQGGKGVFQWNALW